MIDRIASNAFLAGFLFLVLFLSGCREDDPVPVREVRLGVADQPTSGLAHLAIAREEFARAGVPVRIVKFASGKLAVRALLRGDVDAATTSEVPVVREILEGNRISILARTCGADSIQRIVARRSAGIESPLDLAGKRIGTQRASAVHYFLDEYLNHHGIAPPAEGPVFLPATELPEALASRRIDAFSMREPFVTRARELLGEDCLVFEDRGVYFSLDLLVASPEAVRRNPEGFRRLLEGLLASEEALHDDEAAARNTIGKSLELKEGGLDADWPRLAFRVMLEQDLLGALEERARWLQDLDVVPGAPMPDFLALLQTELLESVVPDRVTVIR